MEEIVGVFARGVALVVGAAAVLIVAFGSVEAFVRILAIVVRGRATHGERKEVWRRFGTWLLLGLEFELAADIIESVVAPTWIDIAQLGAIAVIRTFLNYFLEKDLESARESTGAVTPVRGEV